MTSASVGFCSSLRSALSVKLSSGSTLRLRSKRARTFIASHVPLELPRVEVVRHERREIRADVEKKRGLVPRRAEVQDLHALRELRREAIDGVLPLARPSNRGGNDGTTMAPHEMNGGL